MAMTPDDVLKMVKDKEVKFVDFRFTDTRGKEQHVSVPVKYFTKDKFERRPRLRRLVDRRLEGHPGLRHAADAGSRRRAHGPVHRRAGAQHQLRRDRTDRRQALRPLPALHREARRGVPEVHRPGRRRLLRPRARVLHLRRRDLERRHVRLLGEDQVRRSALVDRDRLRVGQHGAPRAGEGRLLPGAAGRHAAGHPQRDVPRARAAGRGSRSAPPRSGGRRPVRDRHAVRAARAARRLDADPQVHGVERRRVLRQDGDLHAEAGRRRQRLGHARAPVGVEGRQEPVRGQRLRRACRTSRCTTSAASSSTPRR